MLDWKISSKSHTPWFSHFVFCEGGREETGWGESGDVHIVAQPQYSSRL